MIKLLKKHKFKLLTLMLSIVSIFTLFLGINKTYAYETDTFSYTISSISTTNNNLNITNTNNVYTISNNDANNYLVDLFLNLSTNNTTQNNITLLINYDILTSNDNVTFTRKTITNNNTNSTQCKMTISFMNNGTYNMGRDVYINNTNAFFITDKNYFSNTIMLNRAATNDLSFNAVSLNMAYSVFNSASYWKLIIYNVDIVDQTQIGLSQYYETYYGQIEDNYNALLSDYNDLQDNYDTLQNSYNSLQSQLNSLQSTYNNLMLAYNSLESDYDTLQANYRTLNTNFNDLYDRYEQLESDYNNLQNTLDNLPNYNGIQSFIDSFNGATFELTGYAGLGPISSAPTYTLNDFENSNFNLSRDTDTFYTWIQNNISTYGGFDLIITLTQPYSTSLSVSFSNPNYNHDISIYSQIDGLSVADYTDYDNQSVVIINENNNYSIIQIRLSLTQQDYDFILSSNIYGDQYMSGYNSGYNQSLREWNNELNLARNTIESQKNTIRTLQAQLNTASQYDLNKLMWTIASTPFESFKQIWNVEFFGVNISTMITGFLTGIIVIWIIKKFFL